MRKTNNEVMSYSLIGLALLLIIILAFVKINFDQQAVFMCQAIENDPSKDMSQCPAHNSSLPWFLTGAFAVSVLILASGIYLLLSHTPEKKPEFKDIDVSGFDEHEKLIYGLLKENKGSMYQSDIIKKTGFSKVQMTRILDKMEHNDIIDRKRRGMTNIVVLK